MLLVSYWGLKNWLSLGQCFWGDKIVETRGLGWTFINEVWLRLSISKLNYVRDLIIKCRAHRSLRFIQCLINNIYFRNDIKLANYFLTWQLHEWIQLLIHLWYFYWIFRRLKRSCNFIVISTFKKQITHSYYYYWIFWWWLYSRQYR